jgi:hypothetical protein
MDVSPTNLGDPISPDISPTNNIYHQPYHANNTEIMVHMNIHLSDHSDKWLSFTAVIFNNHPQPMTHLHAHTAMDYASEQAVLCTVDLANTANMAIPSTQDTPAILIWRQHFPELEALKAGESVPRSRFPDPMCTQCHSDPLRTQCHIDTPISPHPDTETSPTQHTLLHEVLEFPAPTDECMHVNDRAAHYKL